MESRDLGGLAAVLEGGTARGAPLVLLHGLTFDQAMWRPVLAELRRARAGGPVLALDLPGHGGSPVWPAYGLDSVAAAVHEAVAEAGLPAPVVVGHSMAAVLATVYAAAYPAAGVVNVDQPLWMEPAAAFARSLEGEIRGGGFATAWGRVEAAMHMEALPAQARELLRANRHPRQDLVAGYWRELFDTPVPELAAHLAAVLGAVREKGIPYLFVSGHEAGPEYRRWLDRALPGARTEVWPGGGHFPQLADPGRFAGRLAAIAGWGDAA
jgi:pimeloyl-ACP methyl ester carboxylesterase